MKRLKKTLCMLMAMSLILLLAAGCGSTSAPPVAADPAPAAASTETQEAPAAPAAEPAAPADEKPDQVFVLQIGHSQPVTNPRHISLELFKETVEAKTNGGIEVQIFPAGQLGSEKEMLEAVKMNMIQGLRGGQMDFLPRLQIFTLPFLAENIDQVEKLLTSDLAKRIMQEAEKDNMKILALGDAGGFRHFSNNKRLIKSPDDMEDLKMRTPGMTTIDRTIGALGASTVSIPYNDLYMALKTGVADGQENPAVNVEGMKFYEVQKYFTIINYQFHPDPFYVNMDFFNSLPAEYQTILQDASVEMMKNNNRQIADAESKAFEIIRNNCEVYELTPEELQMFKTAVEPVYDSFLNDGLFTQAELDEMRAIVAS